LGPFLPAGVPEREQNFPDLIVNVHRAAGGIGPSFSGGRSDKLPHRTGHHSGAFKRRS
jgi:hypothetical protein